MFEKTGGGHYDEIGRVVMFEKKEKKNFKRDFFFKWTYESFFVNKFISWEKFALGQIFKLKPFKLE